MDEKTYETIQSMADVENTSLVKRTISLTAGVGQASEAFLAFETAATPVTARDTVLDKLAGQVVTAAAIAHTLKISFAELNYTLADWQGRRTRRGKRLDPKDPEEKVMIMGVSSGEVSAAVTAFRKTDFHHHKRKLQLTGRVADQIIIATSLAKTLGCNSEEFEGLVQKHAEKRKTDALPAPGKSGVTQANLPRHRA